MVDSFDGALRAAIQARGLSLERLHVRLAERGIHVSVASLSNWQRGSSRPERSRSLSAVRELEGILEVPPDSLSALGGAFVLAVAAPASAASPAPTDRKSVV